MKGLESSDVFGAGFIRNGIYSIAVNGRMLNVYCDLENDEGNWTVLVVLCLLLWLVCNELNSILKNVDYH